MHSFVSGLLASDSVLPWSSFMLLLVWRFYLFYCWIVFCSMDLTQFTCSWTLGLFRFGAVMNKASSLTVNIHCHFSLVRAWGRNCCLSYDRCTHITIMSSSWIDPFIIMRSPLSWQHVILMSALPNIDIITPAFLIVVFVWYISNSNSDFLLDCLDHLQLGNLSLKSSYLFPCCFFLLFLSSFKLHISQHVMSLSLLAYQLYLIISIIYLFILVFPGTLASLNSWCLRLSKTTMVSPSITFQKVPPGQALAHHGALLDYLPSFRDLALSVSENSFFVCIFCWVFWLLCWEVKSGPR